MVRVKSHHFTVCNNTQAASMRIWRALEHLAFSHRQIFIIDLIYFITKIMQTPKNYRNKSEYRDEAE